MPEEPEDAATGLRKRAVNKAEGDGKGSDAKQSEAAKAAAAKAAEVLKKKDKKKIKGLSSCDKLLILILVMVGLAITFAVLQYVYPVKDDKHARKMRQLLKPFGSGDDDLTNKLVLTAELLQKEEAAKVLMEKALKSEEEAEKARRESERRRDEALHQLIEAVAKGREEAAAKPEGLAEDSLLSVLTDEDMSVLREYLDDHKKYPDRQGASSRSLASDALEAAKAEHEGRVQVVESRS